MTLVGRPAENHPQQVGKRGALDKVDDRRTPRELFDPLNARSKNDQAELRIAAAVCEGVAARGETIPEALEAEKRLSEALVEYVDRWVAVRQHEVVASADTLGALLRMIGPENDVDGVFQVQPAGTIRV